MCLKDLDFGVLRQWSHSFQGPTSRLEWCDRNQSATEIGVGHRVGSSRWYMVDDGRWLAGRSHGFRGSGLYSATAFHTVCRDER